MKAYKFYIITLLIVLVLADTGQPTQAAPLLPDLTVTNISSQFSDGHWFMVYTVKNIGTANAGAFYIKIKRGAVVETEFSTTGLAAGASRTYRRQMPICEFTRTIIVDSRFQIVESNENNNSRTFTSFC